MKHPAETYPTAPAGRAREPEERAGGTFGDPHVPPAWVAGRLRSYRDVRSAFEPWRRLALAAWSLRDDEPSASRRAPRPN